MEPLCVVEYVSPAPADAFHQAYRPEAFTADMPVDSVQPDGVVEVTPPSTVIRMKRPAVMVKVAPATRFVADDGSIVCVVVPLRAS